MNVSSRLVALKKFADVIEHDKGIGAFGHSTLTDFCNWTIRYSSNAFSDEYLRDVSEALIDLCIVIKVSRNYKTDACNEMANNLFLFSQELRDFLEKWKTSVSENDIRNSKDQVRFYQNRLVDALKRFDDLCSPLEFSEWVSQQVKSPLSASARMKSTEIIPADIILSRLDELYTHLNEKLDDIKLGQELIYQEIGTEAQANVKSVLSALQQHSIEQDEIKSTLDTIRRALKHIQSAGLPIDNDELKKSLSEIYKSLNSNLDLQQQLELSLPIIPFLLEYKVNLGAGVDLEAVWKELLERVHKKNRRNI